MVHIRRIFFPSLVNNVPGDLLRLDAEQTHYLTRVLRLSSGSPVIAVCRAEGKNFKALLELCSPSDDSSDTAPAVKLLNEISAPTDSSRVACLIFSLCKGKKNDWIVEKATELGVPRIIALQSERSIVRIKTRQDADKKVQRLLKVAEQAVNQSRQSMVPEISLAHSIDEAITLLNDIPSEHLRITLSLETDALPLGACCASQTKAVLAAGPEGDFSETEYRVLRFAGFQPASLCTPVLRSETAVLAGIAMVQAFCDPSHRFRP